jgi:hypothetical protein
MNNQQAQATLLTYDLVLAAYRKLLEANPRKALVIDSCCVAMLENGHLVCSPLDNGAIDINDAYDFDRSAFVNGGWDGEEEETASHINNPVFMDMPTDE